jgi:hypothetical protein
MGVVIVEVTLILKFLFGGYDQMKKSIVALTLLVTMGLGFTAVSAYAWYCGGPGGGYSRGWSGAGEAPVDAAAYQKFLDETAQLRKSLAVDRAELNAVMAGPEPDPKKVAELTGRIVDNQEALAGIARSANIDAGPGCGFGPNPNCAGIGGRGYGPRGDCPGPGYGGRGAGRCR